VLREQRSGIKVFKVGDEAEKGLPRACSGHARRRPGAAVGGVVQPCLGAAERQGEGKLPPPNDKAPVTA